MKPLDPNLFKATAWLAIGNNDVLWNIVYIRPLWYMWNSVQTVNMWRQQRGHDLVHSRRDHSRS